MTTRTQAEIHAEMRTLELVGLESRDPSRAGAKRAWDEWRDEICEMLAPDADDRRYVPLWAVEESLRGLLKAERAWCDYGAGSVTQRMRMLIAEIEESRSIAARTRYAARKALEREREGQRR